MKRATISKVKAELSKFIRLVRRGEEVMILDRDRPVAMLTAIQDQTDFIVMEPRNETLEMFKSLKKNKLEGDSKILEVLDQERSDRF